MLLAIFAVSSCSTRIVRLVTQTPSVEVPGYRLSRLTLRGWRLGARHNIVSTLLFSFLAAQPCSVTISRWSAAGRFALVSRFGGKAERRLVAENMLKIERQAV
jgi:hypothetical protein